MDRRAEQYLFCISIHTLTWRVTLPMALEAKVPVISIHTLTWRVTQ